MFIVGVDIAKRSHEAIVINDSGGIVKKAFNFKNDSEGFKKLIDALNSISTDPSDFVIGMESTAHYWLALYSGLSKSGYTVHVLNPIQSNALHGMYIRQVKNDEHDSLIIADVIRFGKYTEGGMPPSELYELRELCRARSFIVDMTADLKRKVISLLDQTFPEYETIFANIFGLTSSELLLNCSTPEEILAIDTAKLAAIIEIPSRKRFSIPKAEQIKEVAANSFGKENEPENPTASEAKPSEITLTMGAEDFKGMNYKEAEEVFRRMGFAKFEYRTVDTGTESFEDTICYIEITEWFVGDSHFAKGDKFDADSTVTFFSYKYEAPSPISYSTNDLETAKKGNTGVFSYKSKGGSYDSYWIIDFDEGYVYWFTDGNGDTTCDRLSIDSGTLNDVVVITYHDGDSSWSYGLHFKWQNQPDHLIVQDNDGFTYDYYSTNLSSALTLKAAKTIYDY